MPDNVIVSKSEDLAVRIVNLYRLLRFERREDVMSKQLLRCGTSIGANIAEAQCAQSRADFISKIHIAYKECRETRYWVRLLGRTNYMTETEAQSINGDLDEIHALLTSILMSTKSRQATI